MRLSIKNLIATRTKALSNGFLPISDELIF